jgi:tRNA threonylcarbamoyladenosine biosynthesis protein TsaB
LFSSIEFLFRYLNFQLSDVDLFVAARGPGSFTGLRIGLAAMEGFAAAFSKRGVGVSTLEGLAWNAGATEDWIAPTSDARRGEVYGALYRRSDDRLIAERAAVVLQPADWFAALPREAITFCGDGAERYRQLIQARPEWRFQRVDPYLASALAEIAATLDCGPLTPLYIRKTDAEIARERHESIASPHSQG